MLKFITDVVSFVLTTMIALAAFSVFAFVMWAVAYLVKVAP